ncbi:hypothetical protein IQ06DRAFT_30689 [Phaeosphaeriaceae sp. SRC1lsM3a]|nr:hypothetical protein IQ06DRAFT_30689 [Stagonospora sp. SRC1lsM3a]
MRRFPLIGELIVGRSPPLTRACRLPGPPLTFITAVLAAAPPRCSNTMSSDCRTFGQVSCGIPLHQRQVADSLLVGDFSGTSFMHSVHQLSRHAVASDHPLRSRHPRSESQNQLQPCCTNIPS